MNSGGSFDWLFADPYAEARAFYGKRVFDALMTEQRRTQEVARVAREVAPGLVDEAWSQTPELDSGRVFLSLMHSAGASRLP